jgi:hypothetical protein
MAISKRAFLNAAAATADQTVVAAVASRRIRVTNFLIMAGGTETDVTFQSGDVTAISPLFPCGARGGVAPGDCPDGWFQTAKGEALKVTTGAGSQVAVIVVYRETD